LLSRFAPQGLEFELKGHVSDVFEAAKVSSDIRFAIAKVFESRKIKIATLGNYRDPP
jgi:small-conductance mechanosensitive channel